MKQLLALLGIVMLTSSLSVSACAPGQPWLRFEIYSPLMPELPALRLSVDEQGCAVTDNPPWHVRPGRYSVQLAATQLSALRAEVEQSQVHALDLRALRASAAHIRQGSHGSVYLIADDNEMRLQISADGNRAALRLRWQGLDQDLLNDPDNADLLTLAALRDRLWELGRSTVMRAQP